MFWPFRLLLAKARPLDAAAITKIAISAAIFALFLAGDYALFARMFHAVGQVEKATPLFGLGILRNLLALVFLVAVVILFSSAMTASIGAFFTDLDLDLYHAAPTVIRARPMRRGHRTRTRPGCLSDTTRW